jgi:hypothetical protein
MIHSLLLDVAPPPDESSSAQLLIGTIVVVLMLLGALIVGAFVVFLIWRKRRDEGAGQNLSSLSNQSSTPNQL